MQTTTS